ncbi:YbgA family protein [Legionella jamestowniensis]|uniref:DUF1722 domain-containing protein n=1 Tax=Legionella jamestowniensis TaxID=455 RepID=A0A0W0UGF1_9GAMM|nr:DUF523 and DUF1722 domain-containing protein [Legionella jamestowniensis]KTD06927.1 hypothetical protein Ljam_1122 [Legionella jamestowniensis]OCH97449.1 hypothetical protein A8135_02955 [Legionella jamestowniensis]SFL84992.1 Uncharacterized conserved protein YbbK, DUF523 family [Legionella jamestowniensis DSM 19215]
MFQKIQIGVSSCLLGQKVRFDGGHKRDDYICDLLGKYVEFLPICPEIAIGMGIPRPAVHLEGNPENPRMVEIKNPDKDYTVRMQHYANDTMGLLQNISGYILKSKSPSCGWRRVKVYQEKGQPLSGTGLYAKVLEKHYPNLPIEEEGRLSDPRLRENFIERLFIYKDWQNMVANGLNVHTMITFHTRHKLTLLAHHPTTYRLLGQEISQLKKETIEPIAARYIQRLMQALSYIATPKKHANVLQHCFGYFKKNLSGIDKEELLKAIDNYRQGLLPLIVPITLLNHHLKHYPKPYLENQSYLAPYPEELMLRNHI